MNYYNEFDPKAAAWLRELIKQNLIPNGHVDERSIVDVRGSDLEGYTQCHFFAGIGGWPFALRLAGWPEDRQVWTGSCPCQPFSNAGKQAGFDDKRHLWPEFKCLIAECGPSVCFGEQVASPLGRKWLDGVFTDLEAMGYAAAGADLCAAGVGAPHIRQRLYWVADADSERFDGIGVSEWKERKEMPEAYGCCEVGGLCDSIGAGLEGHCGLGVIEVSQGRQGEERHSATSSGPWDRFDIMHFTDGKKRRIEPGLVPLAHGIPARVVPSGDPGSPEYAQNTGEARVMRIRGYGNSIVPQLAAKFVTAFLEVNHAH